MMNLLHLPSSHDIAYECNIAYVHAKNYIADINIGTNISTIINNIPNWCCFLFLFYFQIIYFVFLLYKSNYIPRLYHADSDADETYCSITDEFSESDIDTEIVDNGSAMEVDDNSDTDNNDTYDKNYKNYMRNTYSNMLPITLTTSEINALNTKHFEYIISDSAKLVDAKLVMLYDSDTTSFWYYINQPSLVDFNTLESIALKYATKYNCMFAYNANVGVCSLDKNIDKNIDKNNTTKSSVYASFKKNKRIEASDTGKSSSNHYRYMGKLLQYEELCAIQSLKSKEPSVLTYNEYKDTLCNNTTEFNTCIDSPTTCQMMQCKCIYRPVNEFPLSEQPSPKYSDRCSNPLCRYSNSPIEPIVLTTIPDHEKLD